MPKSNENNEAQELNSFVEAFTAGLEPDPNTIDDAPPENLEDTKPEDTENQEDKSSEQDQDSPDASDETKNQQDKSSDQKDVPPADDKKDEDVENVFTKSDKAFAELRVTNKQQGETLMRMARLANIDAKNPAEAIEKLSAHLDKIEEKHGNLTYQEVERIRQSDKEQAEQKAQLQEQARKGFEELKTLHKLNGNDIYAFAEKLKEKGLNPFEQAVDVVAQYRSMNYDQLLAAAREEGKELGRQEEIARRTKAQKQSTSPISRQGGPDTGESFDSTEKLRAFLES